MRVPTVYYSLKKMLERGGQHIDGRILNGRKTRRKITPEVAALLLKQETLQAWSGLFISQRVAKLRNEHGVHIGASTLKDFYRKHQVRYLRVSHKPYRALKQGSQQCFAFAERVAELLEQGQSVVYMDEASFNHWLK